MKNSIFKFTEKYETIGFDLDGTIYDEFQFISQFYKYFSYKFFRHNHTDVYFYSCEQWLKYGSSYNKIFTKIYRQFGHSNIGIEKFEKNALTLYREFNPKLNLSKRAKFILSNLCKKKILFLVSDGNPDLQFKKIQSLGLLTYFKKKNIFLTGRMGSIYYKPSTKIMDNSDIIKSKSTIFFGDRIVDKLFAKNIGFAFCKMVDLRI